MKKILLILTVLCTACTGNTEPKAKLQEFANLKDIQNEVVDTNQINFYYDGVLTFIYEPVLNEYVIEYDDADCFDIENIQYMSNGTFEWDVIPLHVEESTFYTIMDNIDLIMHGGKPAISEDSWVIVEIRTVNETGMYFEYILRKR